MRRGICDDRPRRNADRDRANRLSLASDLSRAEDALAAAEAAAASATVTRQIRTLLAICADDAWRRDAVTLPLNSFGDTFSSPCFHNEMDAPLAAAREPEPLVS